MTNLQKFIQAVPEARARFRNECRSCSSGFRQIRFAKPVCNLTSACAYTKGIAP